MSGTPKDMDRWRGDGGMPIIDLVGGAFTAYGVDGEDLGWVGGTLTPTELACNPHGITQAGIHSLVLDACMNFAINAALPGRARTLPRPGSPLRGRGCVPPAAAPPPATGASAPPAGSGPAGSASR